MPKSQKPDVTFQSLYPAVAEWTKGWGWIEMGQDDFSRSFIRVLDIGGMIWEGKYKYGSVDEALKAAEKAIEKWHEENG
jgi:hypothetical protein